MEYPQMIDDKAPNWLIDTPELLNLCHVTLDRLDAYPRVDRQQNISFSLSLTLFPSLFNPKSNEDSDWTWQALSKGERASLWALPSTRKRRHSSLQPWQFRRLVIEAEAEPTLRRWLNREDTPHTRRARWLEIVKVHASAFRHPELLDTPPSKTWLEHPQDMIEQLLCIRKCVEQSSSQLSAYQLSARCFGARSKLLRNRESWLETLFGWPKYTLKRRPGLLELHWPSDLVEGLLLIENWDSYLAAIDNRTPLTKHLIIGYSAGFRASSNRMISQCPRLYHDSDGAIPSDDWIQKLRKWWQDGSLADHLQVFFAGDLDYTGIAIINALQSRFTKIKPFKPQYTALISLVKAGGGHSPEQADKEGQLLPSTITDPWLSEQLNGWTSWQRPFADQEAYW
ncbi:hypothetical protein L4D21_10155 [Photobacterium profundum]|uniref:hypothetical protein n=1 Tax=Photobacterium profundum TaxID=74109 RepID=UPI003D096491